MQRKTSSSQSEERRAHDRKLILNNWPTLNSYLQRVGADKLLRLRNFKSHAIQEMDEDSRYWRDLVRIKVEDDGTIRVAAFGQEESNEEQFEPTAEEQEKIKEEVAANRFPKSIASDLDPMPAELIGVDPKEYFVYREQWGELASWIQWRREDELGRPFYVPFSWWSDQVWRVMERRGSCRCTASTGWVAAAPGSGK
jgi:hypothetical protein